MIASNGTRKIYLVIGALVLVWLLSGCHPDRRTLARKADEAADLGWREIVERKAPGSLRAIEGDGRVILMDGIMDQCQLFGPGVYVESQAYDLNWMMAGHMSVLHRSQDDPIAQRVIEALLKRQHPETGSWPWSDDGCIHELLALALWEAGQHEAALKAVDWAAQWALHERLTEDGALFETEGRHMMKSWNALTQPPLPFDGGFPPVSAHMRGLIATDEYPMMMRMLLVTGTAERYPEVMKRLLLGMDKVLQDPGLDRRNSIDFIRLYAVVYYADLVLDGLLPRDDLYDRAIFWVKRLLRAERFKITPDVLVMGLLLYTASRTEIIDELPAHTDRLARKLLAFQDAGGGWMLSKFAIMDPRVVFLGHLGILPPEDLRVGRVAGTIKSLPTYFPALGLKQYAMAVMAKEGEGR